MNQKQLNPKKQKFAVLAALCIMAAMPILAVADASSIAVINVVPTTTPNVVTVIGTGFNASESVHFALVNETTGLVLYNFTDSATTTVVGSFSKDLTLPATAYGTFLLYAQTSTQSASKEYTIATPTITINPKITVSPPNSNFIKIVGSGYRPTDVVTFSLIDSGNPPYPFTDIALADAQGNFNLTLIIPTSISGNHTLVAASRTGSAANTTITVPDLTGPKGDIGDTGPKGARGIEGPAGKDANGGLVFAAIIISIVSAIIAVAAILKNREPDDDYDE